MENRTLEHHGVKGQKWYIRRYQNKDGTLTEAGKKRYNKEMDKAKAEQAKISAERKVLANRVKTQRQVDRLESMKAKNAAERKKLEEERKAIDSGKKIITKAEAAKQEAKAKAQQKEAVLKSRSAKELYKHADLFTDEELRSAYNRLSLENDVAKLAPAEVEKGKAVVNKINTTASVLESIGTLTKNGANAYNNVARIYNGVNSSGTKLPTIGGNDNGGGGGKKKNK